MELFLPFLSFSFLLLSPASSQAQPSALAGTIERTTKQQVITSIPPGTPAAPGDPFLTSPSGKYAAYFLRTGTAPGAGGFGNDFCYIQIQDSSTGGSVWESECSPASTANACALVFSDDGLAVFDGSAPGWDSGAESADNNPLETLELVDEGDMRLRDKIGELAWRASEDPRANQRCGERGSAGLAPAMPPFAEPIGRRNAPFGQQGMGSLGSTRQEEGQVVVPADGAGGTSFGQPLDSGPFGSGSLRTVVEAAWVGMASATVALMVYGFGY